MHFMQTKTYRYGKELIEMAVITFEVRQTYLARRKLDVDSCRAALKNGDWEIIKRVGHKIKGNAETFRFTPLTFVGIALEQAAQNQDAEQATLAIAQFEKVLESLSADSEY